jgi:hypothetical protein
VEFREVVNGVSYDVTASTLSQLLQGGDGAGLTDPAGGPLTGSNPLQQQFQQQQMALSVPEVAVLTQRQLQELAAHLLSSAPLPWPRAEFQVTGGVGCGHELRSG